MDETKPYFVGPETPLEIGENVRYVNEMRYQRDALLRVARAADGMRLQMERANETWESLKEAELDFGELFEALKELPEGLLEVVK